MRSLVVLAILLAALRSARAQDAPSEPSLAARVVPPLLVASLGVIGAAQLDDQAYGAAGLEVLAGSAGGLPSAWFLEVLDDNPCVTGNDDGYQIYNDLACVVRAGGYAVVVGGGALGGISTYAVGAQLDDLSDRRRVLRGAVLGGLVGSVAAIVATRLVHRFLPGAGRTARMALSASLIGTASTFGYQLAR